MSLNDEEIGGRDALYFASAVTKEGKPVVHMVWGLMRGQLTPEEVVAHALRGLEVAAAAIQDATLLTFLRDEMGVDQDTYVRVIQMMREYRGTRISDLKPHEPEVKG